MAIKFVGFAKFFPTEGCTFASVKRSQKRNEKQKRRNNSQYGKQGKHRPACRVSRPLPRGLRKAKATRGELEKSA